MKTPNSWAAAPKIEWLRRFVEHLVYRCYAADGQLLYIGATNSLRQRLSHHRARTPWWGQVAFINTASFPDRATARNVERAAIEAENPLHNKTHRRAT